MKRILIGPRKYVQGAGVLSELGDYVKLFGTRPLLLWGPNGRNAVGDQVIQSLGEAGIEPVPVLFGGQCTRAEAQRVAGLATERKVDVLVALGGGKVIDTGRAAAHFSGKPFISVPTIAATDAPVSAGTVWYDEQGTCVGFDWWPFNPDVVLVDTAVIAAAPVRAFVAGIGDALATWLEAEASNRSRAVALSGGGPTLAALALARLCNDTLLEFGLAAKSAVEAHVVTPAVEKVVEATVLLSGIGFESGGLASAHSLALALPSLPECHGLMHGEMVAFGIMTQLCLDEDLGTERVERIARFLADVGLPLTLADLGINDLPQERLDALAAAAAGAGALCHAHVFEVTPASMAAAIVAADALGRRIRKR